MPIRKRVNRTRKIEKLSYLYISIVNFLSNRNNGKIRTAEYVTHNLKKDKK